RSGAVSGWESGAGELDYTIVVRYIIGLCYPHRRSDGGTERKRCLRRHPPPNPKLATLTPANSAIFIRADSRVYGSSIRNFGSRNSHNPPSASSPSREPSRA